MKLETKRLILRDPKLSDWKDLVEGLNDLKVSKFLSHRPFPYKKKNAIESINKCLKNSRKKDRRGYYWVIEVKSEKKVIGMTVLSGIDKDMGTAHTSSWINRKYWRKGFIIESKIAVNKFAFNKLKLRRINSDSFKENKASNRMLRKLGYKFEGFARKGKKSIATGKIHDSNNYGLLKEDWNKVKKKLIKK